MIFNNRVSQNKQYLISEKDLQVQAKEPFSSFFQVLGLSKENWENLVFMNVTTCYHLLNNLTRVGLPSILKFLLPL